MSTDENPDANLARNAHYAAYLAVASSEILNPDPKSRSAANALIENLATANSPIVPAAITLRDGIAAAGWQGPYMKNVMDGLRAMSGDTQGNAQLTYVTGSMMESMIRKLGSEVSPAMELKIALVQDTVQDTFGLYRADLQNDVHIADGRVAEHRDAIPAAEIHEAMRSEIATDALKNLPAGKAWVADNLNGFVEMSNLEKWAEVPTARSVITPDQENHAINAVSALSTLHNAQVKAAEKPGITKIFKYTAEKRAADLAQSANEVENLKSGNAPKTVFGSLGKKLGNILDQTGIRQMGEGGLSMPDLAHHVRRITDAAKSFGQDITQHVGTFLKQADNAEQDMRETREDSHSMRPE